jgi:hypothetical protein
MLSLVGNKAGDFACRLDVRHPTPQVLDDLALTVLPGPDGEADAGALRKAIIAEMVEKLQVITRDLQFHEIAVEVEFLSPFPPELCPPEPPSDDR